MSNTVPFEDDGSAPYVSYSGLRIPLRELNESTRDPGRIRRVIENLARLETRLFEQRTRLAGEQMTIRQLSQEVAR